MKRVERAPALLLLLTSLGAGVGARLLLPDTVTSVASKVPSGKSLRKAARQSVLPDEIRLSGQVTDAAVGAGGRYLVLYEASRRLLEVLEVGTGRLSRASVDTERGLLAVGVEHGFVVDSESLSVEPFRLDGLRREATARLPFTEPVRAVTMGSESGGPIVASLQTGTLPLRLVDTKTFARIEVPGLYTDSLSGNEEVTATASADGRVVSMWRSGNRAFSVVIGDFGATLFDTVDSGHWAVPAADGRTLLTDLGLYGIPPKRPLVQGSFLPAASGPFAMALSREHHSTDPVDRLSLVELPTGRPFHTLAPVRGLDLPDPFQKSLSFAKRVFLFPLDGLLVTVSLRGDKLYLKTFDLHEEMEKAGFDYLYVASRPPLTYEPGHPLTYELDVRSKRPVELRLESGPPGMALDAGGTLTWTPPRSGDVVGDVVISATDLGGRSLFHTFRLWKKDE